MPKFPPFVDSGHFFPQQGGTILAQSGPEDSFIENYSTYSLKYLLLEGCRSFRRGNGLGHTKNVPIRNRFMAQNWHGPIYYFSLFLSSLSFPVDIVPAFYQDSCAVAKKVIVIFRRLIRDSTFLFPFLFG